MGNKRIVEIKRCHDCGANVGQNHSPGCDMEECPFCHHQLLSCGCCYELLEIDPNIEPTYSQGLNEEQSALWEEVLEEKGLIPYGSETRFDN
jgi:hypothetical protein